MSRSERNAHILVVDDEESLTDLVSSALRFAGYEVSSESNGMDALRRIKGHLPDLVVLDVRPEPEFTAGHIRGAISVPPQDLKSRLGEIPDGADVVAYCRGPYCVYADDAVRLLTRRGVNAARLEDGFPEWAAAHLPVARSR